MLDILYEDNHLIVCYKPKGLLSQPDISDEIDITKLLKDYIKEKYNKPGNVYLGNVHRLDRNTEGVMVFTKTSKAAARLSEDIKNHTFKKEYLAVVEGSVQNKKDTLIDYLKKDEKLLKSIITNNKSDQEAILNYEVIDYTKVDNRETTLVKIELKTGRFHQIRVQMSNIGHPLYNDNKYGAKGSQLHELPLQAYKLTFYHPVTKEVMSFSKVNYDYVFKYYKDIINKKI